LADVVERPEQHPDTVTSPDAFVDEVAAEETGRAGHQCSHGSAFHQVAPNGSVSTADRNGSAAPDR
jgi:hypothetical protein